MIIGRYLLTALGLERKFYDRVIVSGKGPYEGCLSPTVDISNCEYAPLTDKIVKPKESSLNLYVDECFESENTINLTQWMHIT